jgi:TolA-binding protein
VSDPTTTTDAAAGDPGAGDDDALGDAGKRALQAERAARREAEQRARAAEGRVAELEQAEAKRQHEATVAELRREVAEQHKLPPSLARRLTGSTREELAADAAELAELVGTASKPAGPPSARPSADLRGGNDPDAGVEPSAKDLADRIMGGGGI